MSYLFNNKVDFADTVKDAFNRLSVSQPFTLFDSSHRFSDNGLWTSGGSGGVTFNASRGLIELTLGITANHEIVRETRRVFSYQPGKSLKILNTFVMNPSKQGLLQRVGYYDDKNGIFVELNGNTLGFVKRSFISGSPVDTKVNQAEWNVDAMTGTGPSGISLDITKAQIMWMDIEWLGVGSVRTGFIVDGKVIHCHTFNHANQIASTYMTTACLPIRYEMKNLSETSSGSTMMQICSSVISEGGYELRGEQRTAGHTMGSPRTLSTSGFEYPMVSLRLKASPDKTDSIVVLSAASILPVDSAQYRWTLVKNGTTDGGTWQTLDSSSSVEYNLTGTTYNGGTIVASGYVNSTNQSSGSITLSKDNLFRFQLERDGYTNTPYEMTLLVSTKTTNPASVYGSLDWEEITR